MNYYMYVVVCTAKLVGNGSKGMHQRAPRECALIVGDVGSDWFNGQVREKW